MTSASTHPALVGQWELDRTCSALVQADTNAGLTDLITYDQLQELVDDSINAQNWDPSDPCAHAKPPIEHSHTFWPDGTFNSYDENGQDVDNGRYTIQGDRVTIGDVTFTYKVTDDALTLDPVIPDDCSSKACRFALTYAFAVAFPGEAWTRVTSGPNVPPGTGTES